MKDRPPSNFLMLSDQSINNNRQICTQFHQFSAICGTMSSHVKDPFRGSGEKLLKEVALLVVNLIDELDELTVEVPRSLRGEEVS